MSTLDWSVLAATLLAIAGYGFWRGRGSRSVSDFLLADRSLGWITIALSIMATQASAITFTSTPGQAFVDGMRFLQFYFGLPLAMVILSATAVPRFHRLDRNARGPGGRRLFQCTNAGRDGRLARNRRSRADLRGADQCPRRANVKTHVGVSCTVRCSP